MPLNLSSLDAGDARSLIETMLETVTAAERSAAAERRRRDEETLEAAIKENQGVLIGD